MDDCLDIGVVCFLGVHGHAVHYEFDLCFLCGCCCCCHFRIQSACFRRGFVRGCNPYTGNVLRAIGFVYPIGKDFQDLFCLITVLLARKVTYRQGNNLRIIELLSRQKGFHGVHSACRDYSLDANRPAGQKETR